MLVGEYSPRSSLQIVLECRRHLFVLKGNIGDHSPWTEIGGVRAATFVVLLQARGRIGGITDVAPGRIRLAHLRQ
jgi:hypothetical protein